MIRLLLADESLATLSLLREGLAALGDFEIVGTARDSDQAMELLQRLEPHVLCLGLEPSHALELTYQVMKDAPTPILLLVDRTAVTSQSFVDQALAAGALELGAKPTLAEPGSLSELGSRLRVLSGVKVFCRRPASATPVSAARSVGSRPQVVAMGASTGGPQALGKLLTGLPADFPWPILCVQHMSPGFLDGMVAWLKTQSKLDVRVARGGEQPLPGQVFFAREDRHLRVRPGGSLRLDHGEPIDGHRPSVTALMNSVAKVYGAAAIGILLTGMGTDGARGLLAMARAGALTIAQDQGSSVVYGMPKQAVDIGAVKGVHSLEEIGALLRVEVERRRS